MNIKYVHVLVAMPIYKMMIKCCALATKVKNVLRNESLTFLGFILGNYLLTGNSELVTGHKVLKIAKMSKP
jgi:hypothetical protein